MTSGANGVGRAMQPSRSASTLRYLSGLGLALLILLSAGAPWAARAQSQRPPRPVEETRYTFALVGVPLDEALEHLLDQTRLSLIYEATVTEGRTTFCKAERVTAEEVLACILHGTGLDYARLSSGTYVLIPDVRGPTLYASLTGQILDAETGAPLADANVLLAGEHVGTATNQDGRFAFAALRPGPHRLVITHVAYHDADRTVRLRPDEQGRVALALEPRVALSAPVVVSGIAARLPSEGLGEARREMVEEATPGGVGTPDVVQDLASVVGVRLGDALSDVHVQGGGAGEQQFLLDGMPVFMPVPSGGFVGPFSPFAVERVTVRKAGFGAAYGSYLSGVIEVDHRLASEHSLAAQVDPLSVNARWSGHAQMGRGPQAAWMVAARKGLWDVYAPRRLETLLQSWSTPDRFLLDALQNPGRPAAASRSGDVASSLELAFSDIHAAARLRFGGLRSLRFSFYQGRNAFGTESEVASGTDEPPFAEDVFEEAYRWRNRAARIRYEWVPSGRLFANLSAWVSSYRLRHPVGFSPADSSLAASALSAEASNAVRETGFRLGGDCAAAVRHTFSGALEGTLTSSAFARSTDFFGASPTEPDTLQPVRERLAAYLEDRVALGYGTTLTLGTRLTYLPRARSLLAEPRLAMQYDHETGWLGSWALRGAVGLYRQYLHSFDVATYNVTSLLPRVRLWLPVEQDQRPPEAYHATAAFLYLPNDTWQLSIETYYKHQPRLLVLNYARLSETSDNLLTDADGYAYGTALAVSRKGSRLQLDAQYEYAVARQRVPNRFGGAFVPAPWDAPHRLYLAVDHAILPQLTLTLRWQGIFGRSWGFRQAYYDFLEPDPATRRFTPFDLSDPAAHRLPTFSQWDAGLAYTQQVMGLGVQGRLTLINLLARRNVTDWTLRYDESADVYVRQARRAAAFIPSFSLQVSL
ncbi:MAG: carboxypeptidase-like regulatory domain-containing protein [Rhodothermales bacterium]